MFSIIAECQTQAEAEKFLQHISGITLSIPPEVCNGESLKHINRDCQVQFGNWWIQLALQENIQSWLNHLADEEQFMQMALIESEFYEHLKVEANFNLCFLGEGADLLFERFDKLDLYKNLHKGQLNNIGYFQGVVIAERTYSGIESCWRSVFQKFSDTHFWLPPGTQLLSNSFLIRGYEAIGVEAPEFIKDAEAIYQQGTSLLGRGKYESALIAYTMAQRLRPYSASPHQGRAVALYHLQRYEESLQACEVALKIAPNLIEAHNLKAGILYAQGQLRDALSCCDNVARLDSEYDLVRELRADIVHSLMVQFAPEIDPNHQRGNQLIASGQFQAAIQIFDQVLAILPLIMNTEINDRSILCDAEKGILEVFGQVHVDKGIALGRMGEHAKALIEFEKALELSPTLNNAHDNRDHALCHLGRSTELLPTYDALLKLYPNYAYGYFRKGVILDQLGQRDAALNELDRAIQLEPNMALAHHSKSIVLDRLGKHFAALKSVNEALRLAPTSANIRKSKSVIMRNLAKKNLS